MNLSFAWLKRLFVLLLPVLLGIAWTQLRVETDLNTFFTATDSDDAALLAGLLQSGELSRRYLISIVEKDAPESGPETTPVSLNSFAGQWVGQLAKLDSVERAWRADQPPPSWVDTVRGYARFHPFIYSLNPADEGPALFDPAKLAEKALGLKSVLLSPQGGFVKAIAKDDPLLLSLRGFRGLQSRLSNTAGESTHVGVILQSRAPSLDAEAQAGLQSAIRQSFEALNGTTGGRFELRMTGIPVFTVAAQSEIGRDVTVVSVLSSVAVALVFVALFRSFAALHWMLLIQMAAFATGSLATALVFGQVHSLTLALGATLIGISTDYPIHVLAHSAKHQGLDLRGAAKLLWPSLLLGGGTTVIGYLALGATGFPGLEQIAVFAAASIAMALALTRWVLPALLERTRLHPAHLPGLAEWVTFCRRRRGLLLGIFGVTSVGAVALLPQLRWMEDLQNLAMDMGALKKNDAEVRSTMTSIEPGRFVLVEAPNWETALQRSEGAERRLARLKASGGLDEYHGIYPWLVSRQLQAENAAQYRQALTPKFQASWRSALTASGLSVDKLGNLAPGLEFLNPETVLAGDVRHILAGQIIERNNGTGFAIWLGRHEPSAVAEALRGLEGVRYFSQRDTLNRVAEQHRDRSLQMLGWGIVIMSLAIWAQQRRLSKVLLTLLPSLASVLFIFATWAAMGEEVSFLHVIGLLLAVSLCVDYGIFFMDNRGKDSDVTYHAIASSTLTTIASFGALAVAKTPILPILAISVTLGVTLGFFLCPLVIGGGHDH